MQFNDRRLSLFHKDGTIAIDCIEKIKTPKTLKEFKQNEINSVDISTICNEVHSRLVYSNKPETFRKSSSLWFGALLILQQQCNNLLADTVDLICNNSLSHKCIKRKRTTKHLKSLKIPRLMSNIRQIGLENFTQLHDAAWELMQETECVVQEFHSTEQLNHVMVSHTMQLETHEIITEFCTHDTDYDNDLSDKDLNSFGNATGEEIAYFLGNSDFDEHFPAENRKRAASTSSYNLRSKLRRKDTQESISIATSNIELVSACKIDNSKSKDLAINKVNANNNSEIDCVDFNDNALATIDLNANVILQNDKNVAQNKQTEMEKSKLKSKKGKRIINKQIELKRNDFLRQNNNYYNQIVKGFQNKISKPKLVSAKKLFQNFRHGKLHPRIFIQDVHINADKDAAVYESLLHSIFGEDYTDDMKNYIYMAQSTDVVKYEVIPNLIHEIEQAIPENLDKDNNFSRESVITDAQSVMAMLMTIWALNKDQKKINAIKFLNQMPNRICAALAFLRLLELIRDKFIILTKETNSIIIKNIILRTVMKNEKENF